MPTSIQNFLTGNVSRSTLLMRLLPLSWGLFWVTVGLGILLFPGDYNWKTHVISRVTSPVHNPEGYWLPSIGFMAAALIGFPFAGYVENRLCSIAPRLARVARWAFIVGFLLVWCVVLSQHIVLGPGLRRLHETLARVSSGFTSFGVVCCFLCAFRDRFLRFGGQQVLCRRLAFSWALITLLPFFCGVVSGFMLLGRKTEQAWAVSASGFLRSTMLWQLAFWEWAGVVLLFAFMFSSVLWLPWTEAELARRRENL